MTIRHGHRLFLLEENGILLISTCTLILGDQDSLPQTVTVCNIKVTIRISVVSWGSWNGVSARKISLWQLHNDPGFFITGLHGNHTLSVFGVKSGQRNCWGAIDCKSQSYPVVARTDDTTFGPYLSVRAPQQPCIWRVRMYFPVRYIYLRMQTYTNMVEFWLLHHDAYFNKNKEATMV